MTDTSTVMTDEELTAIALAADPDAPLDDAAVPLAEFLREEGDATLLPEWYMPAPMQGGRRLRGWRRRVAILVIVAVLLIDAAGLCSTYGSIVFA
jgi:hypothetical protein